MPGLPQPGVGEEAATGPASRRCVWLWRDGHIPVSLPAARHCRLSNLARQTERLGLFDGQVCQRNKGFWTLLLTTEKTGQTSSTAGISKYLAHCWNTDPDSWKLLSLSPRTSPAEIQVTSDRPYRPVGPRRPRTPPLPSPRCRPKGAVSGQGSCWVLGCLGIVADIDPRGPGEGLPRSCSFVFQEKASRCWTESKCVRVPARDFGYSVSEAGDSGRLDDVRELAMWLSGEEHLRLRQQPVQRPRGLRPEARLVFALMPATVLACPGLTGFPGHQTFSFKTRLSWSPRRGSLEEANVAGAGRTRGRR